jgi:SAM-dependent methyltransferase
MKLEAQKAIWDREQVARIETGEDNNRRRLEVLYDTIRIKANLPAQTAILNIGIGNGKFEDRLIKAGYQTYSLDPSENAVAAIRAKHHEQDRFKVGSSAAIPFPDNSFDFVVMSEVIEHLNDETLAATMLELRRVLRINGQFIGTCPDNEDVPSKTHTCPHCGERFHRVGHVRSFTAASLRKYLEPHVNVKECHSFRGMHLNWKGLAMYWYNTLPYRVAHLVKPSVSIPQSMGQHLFFVGTAKPLT